MTWEIVGKVGEDPKTGTRRSSEEMDYMADLLGLTTDPKSGDPKMFIGGVKPKKPSQAVLSGSKLGGGPTTVSMAESDSVSYQEDDIGVYGSDFETSGFQSFESGDGQFKQYDPEGAPEPYAPGVSGQYEDDSTGTPEPPLDGDIEYQSDDAGGRVLTPGRARRVPSGKERWTNGESVDGALDGALVKEEVATGLRISVAHPDRPLVWIGILAGTTAIVVGGLYMISRIAKRR